MTNSTCKYLLFTITALIGGGSTVLAQSSGTCSTPSLSGEFGDNSIPYTGNMLAYTCEAMGIEYPSTYYIDDTTGEMTNDFECVQLDGENAVETVAPLDCTGIGTGIITCFVFAATGKTAGSCGSCADNFADDGSTSTNDLAYADLDAGNDCIGQATCDLTATLVFDNPKFKVLAYCGENLSSTDTSTISPAPSPAPSTAPSAAPVESPVTSSDESSCELEVFGFCVCDVPGLDLFFFKWCELDLF